jgi:hypothetical protein
MKTMKWEKVDGYSAALILSEGRYDARYRYKEIEPIIICENRKSRIIRITDNVVRKATA